MQGTPRLGGAFSFVFLDLAADPALGLAFRPQQLPR